MPTTANAPLHLEMDGIVKTLRGAPVLQGASLHVRRGTTAVVLALSVLMDSLSVRLPVLLIDTSPKA